MSKGFANRRVALLASIVFLSFGGLGARLVWLQLLARDQLVDSADKARREVLVANARRGDIVDVGGNLLATSRTLIKVGVDPRSLRPSDEAKWPQLAALLGRPVPEVTKILTTRFKPAAAPVRPPEGVGKADRAAAGSVDLVFNFSGLAPAAPPPSAGTAAPVDDDTVVDDPDAAGQRPIKYAFLGEVTESTYLRIQELGFSRFSGVVGERIYRRVYPDNELAAHVLGYVNHDEQPVTGIEAYADFYLRGQNGWIETERNNRGQELPQFRSRVVPPADGYNVKLSIDSYVQHVAEAEVAAIAAKFQPIKATIIISDPRTGFIKALANFPNFNLNTYNQLTKEQQVALKNIAATDQYEPGSVFKIVAISGAINENLVTPTTTFDCNLKSIMYEDPTAVVREGVKDVSSKPRDLPPDDDHFSHPISVAEIVAHSSNRGTVQMAMMLKDQRFFDYARAFGFGERTGFPVGGGQEIRGTLTPVRGWDSTTITRFPMGQGAVAVTPLQAHMAMGVIASGGLLLRPQVIREIRDTSGALVYAPFRTAIVRRVIKESTARTMASLLTGVVNERDRDVEGRLLDPTGAAAAIPGYDVAGKTGTTQKLMLYTLASGKTERHYSASHHVSSFVGFFPARNPQIEISVFVDDADAHTPGGIGFGGKVAAPSFKNVALQLIPYLDIHPAPALPDHTVLAMGGIPPVIGYLTQNRALFQVLPVPARRAPRTTARPRVFPTMAQNLSDYFAEGEILAAKGSVERPITGIAIDSRRVVPGHLFFALPGRRADGATFIDEAVSRGAAAVVALRLPAFSQAKVTFIQVADPRASLAGVAQRYYRFPDRDLAVTGVTGTNGKTTVTHLLKHFLDADRRVGLIGTVNYDLGTRTVPSFRTTPESLDLFGMMAQMRDAGCRQAVMEVSSHGIDQQRVLGLQFAAAVFTNLTRDHLDYHQTLDAYFEVKTRLFTGGTGPAPKLAVVNLDDPYGERLAAQLAAAGGATRLVTFGEHPRALVRAEDIALNFKNSAFRLVWPGGTAAIDSPLIGRYNVSNLLAAAATAWGLGRDPASFPARLAGFAGVPGRMERIEEGQPFNVLVDYAHTDDALRNALGMLRAITPGRLLVVFGCGGQRDRTKRPLMVRAVQEAADFAFATADNPRGEPLAQIFADMRAGATAPEKIAWIDDRRRALSLALDAARPGDCLLVAGKGHESYQEFADTVIPFDDRQVVRELIGVKSLRER